MEESAVRLMSDRIFNSLISSVWYRYHLGNGVSPTCVIGRTLFLLGQTAVSCHNARPRIRPNPNVPPKPQSLNSHRLIDVTWKVVWCERLKGLEMVEKCVGQHIATSDYVDVILHFDFTLCCTCRPTCQLILGWVKSPLHYYNPLCYHQNIYVQLVLLCFCNWITACDSCLWRIQKYLLKNDTSHFCTNTSHLFPLSGWKSQFKEYCTKMAD